MQLNFIRSHLKAVLEINLSSLLTIKFIYNALPSFLLFSLPYRKKFTWNIMIFFFFFFFFFFCRKQRTGQPSLPALVVSAVRANSTRTAHQKVRATAIEGERKADGGAERTQKASRRGGINREGSGFAAAKFTDGRPVQKESQEITPKPKEKIYWLSNGQLRLVRVSESKGEIFETWKLITKFIVFYLRQPKLSP